MYLIIRWLINTIALLIVATLVQSVEISSYYSALIAALFIGLVNAVLKPILIILTLPINILTLGLFTFVINGLLFWLVASFIKGFDIAGFWPAFWAAFIYGIIAWITSGIIDKPR